MKWKIRVGMLEEEMRILIEILLGSSVRLTTGESQELFD